MLDKVLGSLIYKVTVSTLKLNRWIVDVPRKHPRCLDRMKKLLEDMEKDVPPEVRKSVIQ